MKTKNFLSLSLLLLAGFLFSFTAQKTDKYMIGSGNTYKPAIKLYVLDGGMLENIDPTRFGLKKEDVSFDRFPAPCFLIVHPKGTLMWDAGAIPDDAWKYSGTPVKYKLVLPDREREITLSRPLKMQLTEIGHPPADITYLALSHYHYDHTGNAYQFTNATWLARQNEYDAMFAEKPPDITLLAGYSALRKNKIQMITKDEYDVFGDGTVIIKSAPGHTPGHQVLFLKLPKTGNIVLSGDLYHFPEERTLNKVPTFEYDPDQTRATRILIDTFLKKTNAQLWIQHDFNANAKLKKSPDYYE